MKRGQPQRYEIVQPVEADTDGLVVMHVHSWIDTYPNEEQGVTREFIKNHVRRFTSKGGRTKRAGFIKESYENPDYYLRIAKDSAGKIIGFVDARKGTEPELCGLYIDVSAQGSGLARQMAELALEWLGKDKDIKLVVVAYNVRAQVFYRKLGFEKVPGSENFYNNTPLKVIEMLRRGDEI